MLVAADQMIMPGEKARTHRHTPNPLRLIVDAAPGRFTAIDGVKLAMMPGDVVLTPNWSRHGHGNNGMANTYWLDFRDVRLVQLLEPATSSAWVTTHDVNVSSLMRPVRFR
jgi:gentisate 1,2-dioxygenase